MLEIKNIGYSVGEKEIIKDISFSVNDGDIVSIIGSNGSGKSTLMKVISNMVKAKRGEVILFNKRVVDYKRIDIAKVMSYLSQINDVFINLTVESVVLSGRYPYFSRLSSVKKTDMDIVEKMMDLTNITAMRHRKISSLSGGERQRVFIASSLAQEAKIILLDEPTVYLDPRSNQEIFDLLKRLNKDEGITIVIVSHDINNLLLLNSRFIGLRDGEVLFKRESNQITDKDLDDLYEYKFNYIQHPKAVNNIQLLP